MIDFKQLAQAYEQEMVQDLMDLIAFPSLTDESSIAKDAPFGQPLKETLDWFLNLCGKYGFDIDNVDGYEVVASYGKQSSSLGMLGHLDVVPVGEGWSKDPFKAVIENGVMFGRGTGDDKGPTIAALYAMRILKDLNLPLKHQLQLIVGVDEETGMRCMDYFTKHRPSPDFGFVPDAYFPLIYGEKGIANLLLMSPLPTIIESFHAGERPNIVIGKANFKVKVKHNQEAFEWYQKAAQQGHPTAQFRVARAYQSGAGVAKDEKKAFEWYQKAAEQNVVPAQIYMGLFYATGTFVTKDPDKAREWYKKAQQFLRENP